MMRWLIALPFLLLFASRLEAQRSYTLDDWMTIASVSSFAWSPDAATIYYAGDDAGSGTTEIFRVASNGGEPTRRLAETADVAGRFTTRFIDPTGTASVSLANRSAAGRESPTTATHLGGPNYAEERRGFRPATETLAFYTGAALVLSNGGEPTSAHQ